jgi:flagellar hook-basal body complex protein FliE
MSNPIQSVLPVAPLPSIPSLGGGNGSGASFQSALQEAVGRVEQFQQASQSSVERFLSGEGEEVHQVALAVEQTQMAFDLFLQVRNKVISAYQEVMKMQM